MDFDVVIRGDDRTVVPYLRGFAAGSRELADLLVAEECGVHIKGLRERLKHHGETVHVIVDDASRATLTRALAGAAPGYTLEIIAEHPIASAHFTFAVETPSRKVAAQVRAGVAGLPLAAVVSGFAPVETEDEKAGGPGVYAPSHAYEFRGKGRVEGPVRDVITARRVLTDIEFVECDEIVLKLA